MPTSHPRSKDLPARLGRTPTTRQAAAARGRVAAHSLLSQLGDADVKLVSFDVFDTVITRAAGEPSVVFQLVGEALQDRGLPVNPDAFRQLRLAAERRTRTNRRGREVTLQEIYAEIAFALGQEHRAEAFMNAELAAERSVIAPVPEMLPIVEQVRRRHGRVIYISDMYLPQDFIEERLRSFGLFGPGDRLYISSTCGGWKGDGRLFRTVLDSERLRPRELLHCGNSLAVDVEGARRLGIRAFHYTAANPVASEEILNEHSSRYDSTASLLAGVSRKIRLQAPQLRDDSRVVWDTGASLTGPLLVMYAMWILDRAIQTGVTRLLFLARDAYLPFQVMRRILAARPELEIEAHYVYGSRATYLPLGFTEFGETEWDGATTRRGVRCATIGELEKALLIPRETLARHLKSLGFASADWDRRLTPVELTKIKRHALTDPAFSRSLQQNAADFIELTRDYFAALRIHGAGGTAIVDTGWTTQSHAPLFNFLDREGCFPLRLFYIGMNGKQADVPLGSVDTFLHNRLTAIGARDPNVEYPRAFETLLMAPHGRTLGFRRVGGRVEPILSSTDNRAFIDRLFPVYEKAIMGFVDEALRSLPKSAPLHAYREAADGLVRRFWLEPTPDEARVWSSLEWEADALGKTKYPLARPYRLSDAWSAFVQKKFPNLYLQFWRAGAVRLTPRRVLRVLQAAILMRRILGRITRMTPSFVARRARELSTHVASKQPARADRKSAPPPVRFDRKTA